MKKTITRLALGVTTLGLAATTLPVAPAVAQTNDTCRAGYTSIDSWGLQMCVPDSVAAMLSEISQPEVPDMPGAGGAVEGGDPQPTPQPTPTPEPPSDPGGYRPPVGSVLERPDLPASTRPGGGSVWDDDVNPGDTAQTPPASDIVRYKIEAVRFTATDESGWDRAGSDEPMFTFTSAIGDDSHTVRSREFGNVDSGDTRTLEMCVIESCTEGFSEPLKLSIQLFEMDWGSPEDTKKAVEAAATVVEWGVLAVTGSKVEVPSWLTNQLSAMAGNDLMGSLTLEFDPAELINEVPVVGGSTVKRYHLGGNSGDLPFEIAGGPDYHLELRVTRLPNAEAPDTPTAGGDAPRTGGVYRDPSEYGISRDKMRRPGGAVLGLGR